ncbi:uncharacterized protein LOC130897181 [Diorhabda carinulata]|uniref:uncharacterized protein LOC130897181 n=1 Tax=Diorhabda carinulata TaxID=1163345 RepID=UPI0025A2652E|nr:uncharacterized protein LOC130897181 [Diorhabda carinulata]
MKTIFLYVFAVLASSESKKLIERKRRGSLRTTLSPTTHLQIAGIDNFDLQNSDLYARESVDVGGTYQILTNSLEKPVQESQEYIPPQSIAVAIIPSYPPPATPVNAAASNVPGNGNAVFLGSGSIGVVHLGGGAYVLGSGGLGYSEKRRNPRPSIRSSTLPPIRAHPNLLPAAVNSQRTSQQTPIFSYTYPTGQQFPIDANGYEYLTPNKVGFGDPLPPRPLKVTNTYAVPTSLQSSQFISPTTQYSPPQTITPMEDNQNSSPVYPKRVSNVYQPSYLK